MFDEFCQCGHTKEEHVEKWFSKGIKCLGDDCKCNEFRPTQDAPDRLPRYQKYDTGHPDPMFIVKESRTNGGG